MPYLLDANVFMQAKNQYYGFDFCPGFWEWLVTHNVTSLVYSIEKVGDEIAAGTDEIASPSTKKLKIPNACVGMGVKCVSPFEMLRQERARLVLGPRG